MHRRDYKPWEAYNKLLYSIILQAEADLPLFFMTVTHVGPVVTWEDEDSGELTAYRLPHNECNPCEWEYRAQIYRKCEPHEEIFAGYSLRPKAGDDRVHYRLIGESLTVKKLQDAFLIGGKMLRETRETERLRLLQRGTTNTNYYARRSLAAANGGWPPGGYF